MLIVQVWMKANVSIETPKKVKIPNGNNGYNEISRKLTKIANVPRINHQIT
jgi:hypothetical protein